MNDKILIIAIGALLAIGMLSVLWVVVPWVWDHGIPNWKELLVDDGLILVGIALFVYSFYVSTKMH